MKLVFALLLFILSTTFASAQTQQSQTQCLDQVDYAISVERSASTNIVAVKESRINSLAIDLRKAKEEIEELKKKLEKYEPKSKN